MIGKGGKESCGKVFFFFVGSITRTDGFKPMVGA